jgi:hypothetical protein
MITHPLCFFSIALIFSSFFRVESFSQCPRCRCFGCHMVHGMAMVVPFQRIGVVTTALQMSKLEEQVGNNTEDINSLKEKVNDNTIDIRTMQRDNATAEFNIMKYLDSKADKLESMIKKEFQHVDVKFKNIDSKFDKLELMIKKEFQHVDVKLKNIDSKFDKLESMIKKEPQHVDVKFKNIDSKFDKLELMINSKFDKLEDPVDVKFKNTKEDFQDVDVKFNKSNDVELETIRSRIKNSYMEVSDVIKKGSERQLRVATFTTVVTVSASFIAAWIQQNL